MLETPPKSTIDIIIESTYYIIVRIVEQRKIEHLDPKCTAKTRIIGKG